MLDPDHLRVFLIAAETLNFSRTAERLNMSQPSVTQHIQLLEAHFNAPLFNRTGRKLSLTKTGLALVPLAHQIVSLALHTDKVMEALHKEITGQLIIGCSTTPGKYILPILLADFMKRYPHVQAACHIHPRHIALDLLQQGQVHFALSSSAEEFGLNIEFRKFISDPVVLIAPLDHPWAKLALVEPEALLHERFIVREESAGTYRTTRTGLARLCIHIADLKPILTVGNSEAIAIAVQQGVGLGFVSQMVVSHMVEGKVAQIHVRGLEVSQDIYLCRHRLQPFNSLQAAFWDFAFQPDTEAMRRLQIAAHLNQNP
jgi:DNA-binding transcriptional LysR family regulator